MRRRALASAVAALASAALALAGLASAAVAAPGAAVPPRGTVSVFAPIPSPGFPALPHVVGNLIYEGTYDNPLGDTVPSRVFQFSAGGALRATFTIKGQDLSSPHGVQVAATDAFGRLILLDKTSGRILQLDPRTGAQATYATVADLPTCLANGGKTQCSPALADQPPMPDYAAWGPDGSLYVTDYQQAVIWRVAPGGGAATVWLADRRLDGLIFGTASIALMPDGHTLLFDQASNAGLGGGNPTTGKLYSVRIEPSGAAGPLRALWESGVADAPDGFALSRAGHIYMALVGLTNQIIELDSAGHELARFGQPLTGGDGSPVPFDSPSGVAFLGTTLLIANQSYFTGNPANQALLALETGEQGQPALIPANAGARIGEQPPSHGKPHKKKHKHKKHKHKKHKHKKHKPHKQPKPKTHKPKTT